MSIRTKNEGTATFKVVVTNEYTNKLKVEHSNTIKLGVHTMHFTFK